MQTYRHCTRPIDTVLWQRAFRPADIGIEEGIAVPNFKLDSFYCIIREINKPFVKFGV